MENTIEKLLTLLGVSDERINLEVGKTYISNAGTKLKVVEIIDESNTVNFESVDGSQYNPYTLNKKGTYSFSKGLVERSFSLSPDEPIN